MLHFSVFIDKEGRRVPITERINGRKSRHWARIFAWGMDGMFRALTGKPLHCARMTPAEVRSHSRTLDGEYLRHLDKDSGELVFHGDLPVTKGELEDLARTFAVAARKGAGLRPDK